MIRKFAYVRAYPEIVGDVFNDAENWSVWMPGIEKVEVLESRDSHSRIAVSYHFRGRRFEQILECTFSENRCRMHQLRGFFDEWESHWEFLTPPDGFGTTVKCEIDMRIGGVAAFFASKRMINSFLDDYFREIVGALEEQICKVPAERDAAEGESPPGKDVLLQIFQTEHGLEMWFDDRMYSLSAKMDG